MLNLHQLTDSKVQLNESNVNNHKSNDIVRSYQEDTGVTWRLWRIGFCKQVSFKLFPEGGNRCCTAFIIRKIIPDLGSIKTKAMAKDFYL